MYLGLVGGKLACLYTFYVVQWKRFAFAKAVVWIPVWTTGCRKWIKPRHLDGKMTPSCSSLPLLFWWLALLYLHHRILTLAVLLLLRYLDSCCPPFVIVSQLCCCPACVAGSWLIYPSCATHSWFTLCPARTTGSCNTSFLSYLWLDLGSLCPTCATGFWFTFVLFGPQIWVHFVSVLLVSQDHRP